MQTQEEQGKKYCSSCWKWFSDANDSFDARRCFVKFAVELTSFESFDSNFHINIALSFVAKWSHRIQ